MEVVVWFADVRGEDCAPCMRIGGEGELFEESQRVEREGKGGSTFSEREPEGVLVGG